MTENDTDIDFDFFEDEPPTQETSRTDRLIPRRGPRGPEQPPRAPTNLTPLLRLIGLIAFAILIVVLLVILGAELPGVEQGQDLQELHGQGLGRLRLLAAIGKQLSQVLLAQGLKEAQVEQRVAGLAHQEQLDVERARAITPPGTLRDEHQASDPGAAVPRQRPERPRERAGGDGEHEGRHARGHVLASQMQRLLASDVIYQDSFKAPSSADSTARASPAPTTPAGRSCPTRTSCRAPTSSPRGRW